MRYSDPFELIGTVVDHKYLIEAVVGEGGFSVVYRAMHLIWKRPVAIKAFRLGHVALGEREALVEAFVREGALLTELSERSVAICQARDVATLTTTKGDWVPYLVLEWLEGETLEAWMTRARAQGSRPSLDEAVALLGPAIDALSIAHAAGIVHRDVKPANLFIVGARTVKLVDFGIAKVVRDARERIGVRTREACSYTPGYGAPEQVAPVLGDTGPWTDVFSMALILVEMISGRDALVGRDIEALSRAALDPGGRPTPRARGALVSDAVETVFKRALAVRPADRPSTARHFLDALRSAMASDALARGSEIGRSRADQTLPPVVLPSIPRPPSSPASSAKSKPPQRRRAPLGAAAATVGLLLAIGALGLATRARIAHSFTTATASIGQYSAAPAAAMPLPPLARPAMGVALQSDAGALGAQALAR